jgi:hypothetical protein
LKVGCHGFAGTTPRRPKIHHYRQLRSCNKSLKGRIAKGHGCSRHDVCATLATRQFVRKFVVIDPVFYTTVGADQLHNFFL